MENEKFVEVRLSYDDLCVLDCVLSQYIYDEEHCVLSSGDVVKLDSPAHWGKAPLAPIAERLWSLRVSFDKGDTLLLKKSCS